MGDATFDPDVINAIFKLVWNRRALEREKNGGTDILEPEMGVGTSKRIRPTSANSNALKLSCELLQAFVTVDDERDLHIEEDILSMYDQINDEDISKAPSFNAMTISKTAEFIASWLNRAFID